MAEPIPVPPPPVVHPCAGCHRALVVLWSPRKRDWVVFATDPVDTDVLRVHRCKTRRDRSDWRNTPRFQPDQIHRGAARAAVVLAETRAETIAARQAQPRQPAGGAAAGT